MIGSLMVIAGHDDGGFRGEIVEKSGCLIEKQGQIILAASGTAARTDFGKGRAAFRVDIEAFVPIQLETLDSGTVKGVLASRQQFDRGHFLDGALALRVERAQAVDVVIQQIDPVGQLAAHGVDVEQGAAQSKLTVFIDRVDVEIAIALQPAPEAVDIQPLTLLEQKTGARDKFGRRQALHQGGNRYDQDATGHAGQAVQGAEAIGNNVLVRREVIVG